jgi:ubiquinone/menaquinone biosynthesis C-methylase UbiE
MWQQPSLCFLTFPSHSHAVVLEIGPGLGYIMEALNHALTAKGIPPDAILGLDISRSMVRRAAFRSEGKGPYQFVLYDGVTVPLSDQSIDFIISVATLQHISKPFVYNLFFEVHRLLKPSRFAIFHLLTFGNIVDGYFFEPKISWREEILRQVNGEKGHWIHFYAREELEIVLSEGTGFRSVDVRHKGGNYWVCVQR